MPAGGERDRLRSGSGRGERGRKNGQNRNESKRQRREKGLRIFNGELPRLGNRCNRLRGGAHSSVSDRAAFCRGPHPSVIMTLWSFSVHRESCCTSVRCLLMAASAIWVRPRTSLWHFWPRAKQHIWQVLPLCPTGYGNSPYAGSSAFAGNPALISLEVASRLGLDRGRPYRRIDRRRGSGEF